MKFNKIIIIALAFAAISNLAIAQKVKGEGVLTVGTSIGVFVAQPSINAIYDYSISDRFSIGLGANYIDFRNNYYGNITRTNIGVRSLFHLIKVSKFDLYGGLRLGASIWAGQGTYSFLDRVFTAKGGDVYPSAQIVVGVRYLFKDWIGINTEVGLGSPYLFSIGLSANLGHTPKAVATIKDAYHEEIIQAEKKNILKLKLGSLMLGPGLSYERYLKNRFSFELGASYKFYDNVQSQGVYISSNDYSENDSVQKGIKAYGLVKFYITAKRNPFPKGLYVGASYSYYNQTMVVKVEDLRAVKNPVSFDYEKITEQHAGGIVMGYQLLFAKRFTFDAFGGFQFGTANLLSYKYLDKQASEEKFFTYFGQHQNPLQPNFKPIILKVNFGYMF